jgi:DNA-binding NarL/FixJ family response regulator
MKILVVDDHLLVGEALRHWLKPLDPELEAMQAQTAEEALAVLASRQDVSLILLDLSLPDADGFTVLRSLRESHPQVPVVVLSASNQREIVMRALDGGAMGFIPKTSNSGVLVGALRLVLSGGVYLPPEILRPAASSASAAGSGSVHHRDIGLTDRQAQVLALLIEGKPNKLICRELNLAEGTVKIHVTAVLKALDAANRTQAVIAASRLGLKLEGLSRIASRG